LERIGYLLKGTATRHIGLPHNVVQPEVDQAVALAPAHHLAEVHIVGEDVSVGVFALGHPLPHCGPQPYVRCDVPCQVQGEVDRSAVLTYRCLVQRNVLAVVAGDSLPEEQKIQGLRGVIEEYGVLMSARSHLMACKKSAD